MMTNTQTIDTVHETKARILEAAYQRLAREGYGALSVREVAKDAGVNHALVSYHFKSKDLLVIAVLDEANRRLLARQQRMYQSRAGGYADKWAQARRYYENDLASGFVRVLIELYAASMSNAALREQFRPRINAWFDVVCAAVKDAIEHYGLDLPISAEAVACWISNFWIGMELSMLTGTGKPGIHAQALDALEAVLRQLDTKAPAPPAAKSARARTPARTPKRKAKAA